MPIFRSDNSLMYLRKTPVLLRVLLTGVDQDQATATRDGADGWDVLQIVCHLNDYEDIFLTRLKSMLQSDQPAFPSYNADTLAAEHNYEAQQLNAVLSSLANRRAEHIRLLESLTPEQWQRTGLHSTWGVITVVEQSINTALHDLNHMEQIARVLGL